MLCVSLVLIMILFGLIIILSFSPAMFVLLSLSTAVFGKPFSFFDFEIDAASAHSPENAEQWISKSTPLASINQKTQNNGFLNRTPLVPIAPEMKNTYFEMVAAGAHNQGNSEQWI